MAWLFLAAVLSVTGTLAVTAAIAAVQGFRERRARSMAPESTRPSGNASACDRIPENSRARKPLAEDLMSSTRTAERGQ